MWNNYTLVSEMLGGFVLVFGVLATIKASSAKKFSLQGTAKHIFVALGIALSLMLAVYAAEIKGGHGWANPAVALMGSIAAKNFDHFFPAIVGEFIGGIAAVLIAFVGNKLMNCEKPVTSVAQINAKESFLGEIPGSVIFLGGVAIAAGGAHILSGANDLTGIIVGLSIFAAISLVGWRFALLLNPMVGAVLLLNDLLNKEFQKANLVNYAASLAGNLSVAAAIGAVYYGISTWA